MRKFSADGGKARQGQVEGLEPKGQNLLHGSLETVTHICKSTISYFSFCLNISSDSLWCIIERWSSFLIV